MSRTRASSKQVGARFEQQIADYLAEHVDDRVERRAKNGPNDRGDITGLRHMTGRLVVECKNVTGMKLPEWGREVEIARGNDDALAGIVASKRHGNNSPGDQWVHMTVDEFIALLNGNRDHLEG